MRVVNQADELVVWSLHRCHHDVVASFGDWLMNSAAVTQEIIDCRLHVVHAEVCPWTVCHICIWVESEFVATNIEARVKRLVEIGLYAKHVRPPGFIRLKLSVG